MKALLEPLFLIPLVMFLIKPFPDFMSFPEKERINYHYFNILEPGRIGKQFNGGGFAFYKLDNEKILMNTYYVYKSGLGSKIFDIKKPVRVGWYSSCMLVANFMFSDDCGMVVSLGEEGEEYLTCEQSRSIYFKRSALDSFIDTYFMLLIAFFFLVLRIFFRLSLFKL